ncbi:MAG: DUF1328 domain-containing protein [Bdellovibrionales bacterium]|nr:DUF1328 domain-containing protein [Bdellovibrionales bacterium]
MLNWALTFFLLAIVAGILGFTGIAGTLAWGAKVLFVAFIVLTVLFAVVGRGKPIA